MKGLLRCLVLGCPVALRGSLGASGGLDRCAAAVAQHEPNHGVVGRAKRRAPGRAPRRAARRERPRQRQRAQRAERVVAGEVGAAPGHHDRGRSVVLVEHELH